MTAIQAVDGNRKPKYEVSQEDRIIIRRRIEEIWRRLELKTGSPINPHSLGFRLQAMVEDRVTLPGDQAIVTGGGRYSPETIPVLLPLWLKLLQCETRSSGMTEQAALTLAVRLGINNLGDLLLYTAEEIEAACGAWVVKDAQFCLGAISAMRLPTASELDAAHKAGFWTELQGSMRGCSRVATCMLGFVDINDIDFGGANGFFWGLGINTLGELLSHTPEQIKTAWISQYFERFPHNRKYAEEVTSDAERVLRDLLAWAAASGLKFAS